MFFIESEEEFTLCPNCGSELTYHSRVIRPATDATGEKKAYSIRVMRCCTETCPSKYHRELPDAIVPYKRYCSEAIEEAIDPGSSGITVAADESTIRRWREWFQHSATQLMMALLSVAAAKGNNTGTSSLAIGENASDTALSSIKAIVGREEKWLCETVRILVNTSRWAFNRSAFLTG